MVATHWFLFTRRWAATSLRLVDGTKSFSERRYSYVARRTRQPASMGIDVSSDGRSIAVALLADAQTPVIIACDPPELDPDRWSLRKVAPTKTPTAVTSAS